ncbi:hypothetical protein Q9L42_020710 (plasmid) [Methylomarinum sp. Ch1-1]|uniref:Uncharacterized protein n=1 Tax=Methylomarinum roseum TaxID=3067653 RepID=A0AAU7P0E8_9GAMM|nr:hypothetical protein [Methylomarinum sp. Ch1-1]MDP4523341.1 hypothetical protein [Methylomarinum sp. Ch1-1]
MKLFVNQNPHKVLLEINEATRWNLEEELSVLTSFIWHHRSHYLASFEKSPDYESLGVADKVSLFEQYIEKENLSEAFAVNMNRLAYERARKRFFKFEHDNRQQVALVRLKNWSGMAVYMNGDYVDSVESMGDEEQGRLINIAHFLAKSLGVKVDEIFTTPDREHWEWDEVESLLKVEQKLSSMKELAETAITYHVLSASGETTLHTTKFMAENYSDAIEKLYKAYRNMDGKIISILHAPTEKMPYLIHHGEDHYELTAIENRPVIISAGPADVSIEASEEGYQVTTNDDLVDEEVSWEQFLYEKDRTLPEIS